MQIALFLTLLLLVTAAPLAHAGIFSRFCEKYIVTQDPYEFNCWSDEHLLREYDRLRVLRNWDKASRLDLQLLNTIEMEFKLRRAIDQGSGECLD